jgi:hypothetical protein
VRCEATMGVGTRLCTLTIYCGIWNYEKGCRGAIHCARLGSRSAFQGAMNCAPTLCSIAYQFISLMCIIASHAGWGGCARLALEGHSASWLCDPHHSTPRDAINRVPTPLDIASLVLALTAQKSCAYPVSEVYEKGCGLTSVGADKSAMGAINRPLQRIRSAFYHLVSFG